MAQQQLKIFYLKKKVIFPYSTVNIQIKTTEIVDNLTMGNKILSYPVRSLCDVFFYKNKLATLGEILGIKKSDEFTTIQIKGLERVKIKKIDKFKISSFETIDITENSNDTELMDKLRKKSQELIFLINVDESEKLINLLNYIIGLDQLSDFISNYFVLKFQKRYKLYKETKAVKRCKSILKILNSLIAEIKSKGANID